MKSLIKGGVTATALSTVLFSTAVQATDLPPLVQKHHNTATSVLDEKTSGENTASILPADTPMTVSINTNYQAWAALRRFQLFDTAFTLGSQLPLSELTGFLPDPKDIQSLLGEEVVLAFMPKAESTTATIDSQFLVLAPVKDVNQIKPLLEKFTAKSTAQVYKGFTIWQIETSSPVLPLPFPTSESKLAKPEQPKKQPGIAIAILPGYVAIGITSKSIEQLIDSRVDNKATLAQNPEYQRATHYQEPHQALFKIYENPGSFFSILRDFAKDPALPFPIFGLNNVDPKQIQEFSSISGCLYPQTEGLRLQVKAYLQAFRTNHVTSSIPSETILTRMPGVTYSAFTGQNFHAQWQVLTAALSQTPETKLQLKSLRDFVKTSTGLDLDRDIIGWMDGEYAVFSYPTKGGLSQIIGNNFNLGIGLAVQTHNRDAAETTLKKLNQFIQSSSHGEIVIKTHTIKGKSVTSWELQGSSSLSPYAYSWVDNNTIVVTTGLGAIADLISQHQPSLPSGYNFTTATRSLPHPNDGYLYVNMGSLLSWAYGFIPSQYSDNQFFQTFKQMIGSIYSLSATNSTTSDQAQFDFLTVLAPTRRKN